MAGSNKGDDIFGDDIFGGDIFGGDIFGDDIFGDGIFRSNKGDDILKELVLIRMAL